MNQDSGIPLTQLQVDGGMTSNRLLMQLQADILCIPVGMISVSKYENERTRLTLQLFNWFSTVLNICLTYSRMPMFLEDTPSASELRMLS